MTSTMICNKALVLVTIGINYMTFSGMSSSHAIKVFLDKGESLYNREGVRIQRARYVNFQHILKLNIL